MDVLHQKQKQGETPSNLLSSDDERVPVELIRVAFIKEVCIAEHSK